MKNKLLWILSGITGAIFLIIAISLAIADKIQTTALIIFIVVIVLAVFIIDMSFYIINKRRDNNLNVEHKNIKIISIEDAKKIVTDILGDPQYSEYEGECLYEDIWHMGESKTPVYVKLVKGEFDGKVFGVLINMENSEKRSVKQYTEYEITKEELETDMNKRANILAVSPRPTPSSEEEVIERPSGERVTRKRILSKPEQESKKEGELK